MSVSFLPFILQCRPSCGNERHEFYKTSLEILLVNAVPKTNPDGTIIVDECGLQYWDCKHCSQTMCIENDKCEWEEIVQ
jgi:hypothetical protein